MKTTAKGTVLIVDGDAATRRVAEVGLRHAGYRVTVAGSPEQALWFLERAWPDAVLTAIQFDDEPLGWELVRFLRAHADGSRVGVLALRTEVASREGEAIELADDVVPWPAGVRELELRLRQTLVRRRVATHLAGVDERRLRGDLTELSAIDLLTLVERSQTSGTLEIESPRGLATLWFADGRVIDAQVGRFTGEEAVFQALLLDVGHFEWTIAANMHAEGIHASMAETLAENLRRLDEWTRLCDELPDLDQALRVDPQRLQATRMNLPAEQVALVERCNGRRSIRTVIEESEIDPLLSLEVLRYLIDAKVLAPASAGDLGPLLVDVGELPPLPSFPEPFPGTSEELGMDTPLVSGIPEDPGESSEFEGLEGLDEPSPPRFDPGADDPLAEGAPEVSIVVREGPARGSASAYVFRPPRGGPGAPEEPAPPRRHESVRIPLVNGRVDPPKGIKTADAVGEVDLPPVDARMTRKVGRRRQSIVVHRVQPLRSVNPGPVEAVRSIRSEVMSPSGLIAVGEILVGDAALAPDTVNPAAGTIAAPGSKAAPSERSGRWSDEGPEALLLPESLDDLGRLSAMAAEFAHVTGEAPPVGAGEAANTPPTRAPARASSISSNSGSPMPEPIPPRPLLRPPEPVEESFLPFEVRRRWLILLVVLMVIAVVLLIALRSSATSPKAPPVRPSKVVPTEPEPEPASPKADEAPTKATRSEVRPVKVDVAAAPPSADPEALNGLYERAEALYRRGRGKAADRLVDQILAQAPRHARALVLRANLALDGGKLPRASAAARAAVEADPELAEAYLTLGVVAQEQRAWAEALAAYERYLELEADARYADSVRRQIKTLRRKVP